MRCQRASITDLAMLWAGPAYASPLFSFFNGGAKEPDRYVAYLSSGGAGMPDRDYYLDDSEKGREIQAAYRVYMALLLGTGVYAMEDRMRAQSAGTALCAATETLRHGDCIQRFW
jgi:putative endopeptidase